MKANHRDILVVRSKAPPSVEIDTEASAAYVRFRRTRVVKTIRHRSKWPIVTLDLDGHGQLVGIEFVGVKKFNLSYLLQGIHIKAPARTIGRATYVSADAGQDEK